MMSWFDIIISLILLGALFRGINKGIVMQLTGFASIIIGAIFAGKVSEIILPILLNATNISYNVASVVSYILAFIVIAFSIKFIGKMLQSLFETIHVSFLNKILGGVIGVAGTMIFLSIMLNLAVMLDPEEEVITSKVKSETFFYSRVQVVVPTIVPFLDKELWEKYIPNKDRKDDSKEVVKKQPSKLLS